MHLYNNLVPINYAVTDSQILLKLRTHVNTLILITVIFIVFLM